MSRFTLSPNSFRKKSTPQDHLQSSQQQYPNAADVMDSQQQHANSSISIYEVLATAEIAAEAKGRAITADFLPASDNNATIHGQEDQQEQPPPPLSSSPSPSASAKFALVIRRCRRQQQEPSSSSQQQQHQQHQQHQQQQTQQQQSVKSLVNVLLTSTIQNKRNKSHIFKEKDKEDREKEQQHQQEQDRQLQVNEKVRQFHRAPLPDQWTTTAGSHPTQVNNNGDSNNNINSNMVGSWLQQNCNNFQQHRQKESKREIATTAATTSTATTTMRDRGEVGIVEATSSPHEGQSWHQELSALSPIMQQQKEWHQHEERKEEQSMGGAAAFVSEGAWTRIKKRPGLSSSQSLPSFIFKNGDHSLRQRQGLPSTPTGAPSQIINAHADNDGRALVSLTDTTKAMATTARDRGASTTATSSRRKNKGCLFFSSFLPATAGAAIRKSSHGNLIIDSPLSSPIATMSTAHSAAAATIPPCSHSLASFSFPPCLSNNIINDNDRDFSFFYPLSSSPSLSPNDDTDDVEAQRSRLNAIRYSWHQQLQSPGDPVLIPSSTLPSHKKVQRSNAAAAATTTPTNNNVVISKSPSQYTNSTTFSSTTSGATPTNSFQLRSSGYNQNRNSRAGSAFLDQETTRTWRGLFASVRQLSHDTSTTGSSTHSSASTISLSYSAQSFNEKDQRLSRKTKHDSYQSQYRESHWHSKHRNSNDASTIRGIAPFFARRPLSSSQHKITTTATASSSTIDLEKRAIMTKSPPRKLTILVVGDGAVGKSALTLRFLRDQFTDEYDPTIEDSYCKHIEVDGQDYTLELTDTAGQSEYRDQWDDHFMRTGDGFICVYSIASMSSFQELVGFRDQIWRAKGSRRVPIVITGNKCDLEDGGERQVHTDVGALFAERSNALFVETSAKTGVNIHEIFTELVREIERARVRAGYSYSNLNSNHSHHHNRTRSNVRPGRQHQHHPSTSSSRSRNYPHPPPPIPPTGTVGGSSIRSGAGITMYMIGTPAASTKGYSTNVTPPAVNGPGNGSRNRKGSRSRSGGAGGGGPVVASMGVDRDVERGICCCIIM